MILGALSNADKLYAEFERWPESLTFANLRLRARGLTYSARIKQDRLSDLIDRLLEFSSRKNSEERPYRKIVINSLAGVGRQAITFIETKAAPLIKIDAPNYAYVADALGRLGSDMALPALSTALQDEEWLMRMHAEEALGQIGSDKAVATLITALQHEDSIVHLSAAQALAQINPETLISGLTLAVNQPDAFGRKKQFWFSLTTRTMNSLFGQLGQLSRSDEDPAVRVAAREAAEKFARKMELLGHFIPSVTAHPLSDSLSKEGVLVHEVGLIVSSAGHLFREVLKYDEGIDGEIEFRDAEGRGSGERVYLQLKSGDSYLARQKSGKEIFRIKKPRHAQYWCKQPCPVLLVIRDSSGRIRWMNVTEYLQHHGTSIKQIEFQGEPFTAESIKQMPARFAP